MRHIVSISGGAASSVAADLVIRKYGRENVTLWFSDTLWEDGDTYRFIDDCMQRWGGELVRYCDGRTPPDVWNYMQIIPNSLACPCARILKIEPFKRYVSSYFYKPVAVCLGMDWDDARRGRCEAPRRNYEQLSGVVVHYPLLDNEPFDLLHEIRSWGIEPPRMYGMGFPHNNCGGRCPKQGQRGWLLLRAHFPERYNEMVRWENEARMNGGARASRAFLKQRVNGDTVPLTLERLGGEQ